MVQKKHNLTECGTKEAQSNRMWYKEAQSNRMMLKEAQSNRMCYRKLLHFWQLSDKNVYAIRLGT